MAERLNVTETVTQEMFDAEKSQFEEMGMTVGSTFERPETDQEVAERDPSAKLIMVKLTQAEYDAAPEVFTEMGLKVGDDFERLATDEEIADMANGERDAATQSSPTAAEGTSNTTPNEGAAASANGERHPLA